uniref:Phosphoinositide phospholipase C n=1 Tax=Eptatretus burgeri TaxID=7764 RepID=A0A8C4Q6M3_EPTBU
MGPIYAKSNPGHGRSSGGSNCWMTVSLCSMSLARQARTSAHWADRSCSGTLEYDEFVEFYQALTQREEVRFLFQRLCHDTNNVLSASKLTSFLQDCQGELDAMKERATYLINKHEPCEIVRERGCMTFDGFLLYLTSPDGSVFNPTHGSIHQSMKEPLSHYFISSSHNTYLLQDQLRGPSSTEAYIKAFLKGCRCVELDCWDGPNEEPVIYHGYTLTSKILFRDVIQVVEKYAFKVSEYPVILSIENHCSLEQQRVMAHHMKSILKNKLLTEPVQSGESEQPSPEQLKGKVLIKGKKLIRVKQPAVDVGFRAAQNGEVGEVSDEDEAAEMEDEDVRCKVKNHGKERHQNLARELSDCIVYCRSVHFPGLSSPRHPWETSSLSEGKANKLLKEGGRELVCHNRQFLMRVYPAARRTDSSNFDPMPYWSAGYQIVALNFQTPGDEMDLYEGWFKQNGSCGLVLKPMCLRSPTSRFSPTEPQSGSGLHPVRLKIKVISGQQLPKVANSSKGSIVDPLVRVEIHGVPSDNARLETKYIDNNGFSPQWNESLSFVLTVPELALVRFVVEDHDTASRNDFVAQYTLPFSSLCRGYRHVHLLSQDGTSVAPSSLFVYIHITDLE